MLSPHIHIYPWDSIYRNHEIPKTFRIICCTKYSSEVDLDGFPKVYSELFVHGVDEHPGRISKLLSQLRHLETCYDCSFSKKYCNLTVVITRSYLTSNESTYNF